MSKIVFIFAPSVKQINNLIITIMTYFIKIQLPNGKIIADYFSGTCFDECVALADGVFRSVYEEFIIKEITLL